MSTPISKMAVPLYFIFLLLKCCRSLLIFGMFLKVICLLFIERLALCGGDRGSGKCVLVIMLTILSLHNLLMVSVLLMNVVPLHQMTVTMTTVIIPHYNY